MLMLCVPFGTHSACIVHYICLAYAKKETATIDWAATLFTFVIIIIIMYYYMLFGYCLSSAMITHTSTMIQIRRSLFGPYYRFHIQTHTPTQQAVYRFDFSCDKRFHQNPLPKVNKKQIKFVNSIPFGIFDFFFATHHFCIDSAV